MPHTHTHTHTHTHWCATRYIVSSPIDSKIPEAFTNCDCQREIRLSDAHIISHMRHINRALTLEATMWYVTPPISVVLPDLYAVLRTAQILRPLGLFPCVSKL